MRRTSRAVRTGLLGAAWMLGAGSSASALELKALAIMMPEEPTDYGWNQQGFAAAKAVAAKYGLKFMPATGLGYGDVHSELRELADDGASLIIAHAAGYNTRLPKSARRSTCRSPSSIDPKDSKPGAVADYTLSGHQGAYLAGVLAAKTTQTGVRGHRGVGRAALLELPIGGLCPRRSCDGPGAANRLCGHRTRRLFGRRRGRRVTESVIGAGADVIFGQGDGASFGMLQAVETRRSTSGRQSVVHRRHRRQDSGRQGKPPLVRDLDLVPRVFSDDRGYQANKFGTHAYPIQLADESVHLLHSKYIPDGVWSQVDAVRKQIVDGKLKIEADFRCRKGLGSWRRRRGRGGHRCGMFAAHPIAQAMIKDATQSRSVQGYAEVRSTAVAALRQVTKRFSRNRGPGSRVSRVSSRRDPRFVGRKRAGKSTLVSLLAGMQQPDEGEILIGGTPAVIDSPRRSMDFGIGAVSSECCWSRV